jgi:hypothetical protein
MERAQYWEFKGTVVTVHVRRHVGIGVVSLPILDFDTRWKQVVRFKSRPLLPEEDLSNH